MLQNKYIWITGASSGIGEAMAIQWAQKGVTLILSGRNADHLSKTAAKCEQKSAQTFILPFDLTSGSEIRQAVEKIIAQVPRIDILVNNGGISQRSTILDTDETVARRIMETDFWGHVNLTRAILPFMIKGGGGKIVVISSLSGLFGFPQRSFYCAAKHALHGYFETLRLEHDKDNIQVTMVCPGRVRTQISFHALTADGAEHGQMDPGQENGVTAEHCALKIAGAVNKGRKQIIIGKKEIIMPYLKRFFPWLFYKIATRLDPNN